MLTTFKTTLKALARQRDIFVWCLLFPIMLSCLFGAMLQNLEEYQEFGSVPVAVVADANYDRSAVQTFLDALGEKGDDQVLDVRECDSRADAEELLRTTDEDLQVAGIILVDADGDPDLVVSSSVGAASRTTVGASILERLVNAFCQNKALLTEVARTNPAALANVGAIESLGNAGQVTRTVSLTHSSPKESVRFFYALLGMAALLASQTALMSISLSQANLSALGARRQVGALGRGRTLAATLAACWVASLACLTAAFLFMRFVIGVDFGGREGLCVVGLAVASLFATAFGAAFGAIPKVDQGVKGGIMTGVTCGLSLFAGLYGEPCMELADKVAREMPLLASLNPAKLTCDMFYSLYCYDTLAPFWSHAGTMVAIAAACAVVAALLMRRQRYEHL